MSRVVVWGAGELGGRVAALRAAAGDAVVAVTRTPARHAALAAAGATPALALPDDLGDDDALLVALPGTDRQMMAVASLRERPPPGRVVLVSSTGFYGSPRGDVDEATKPGDDAHAGQVAACEALFAAWAGARGVILRCGGLYRVGRGPLSALAKSGVAPPGPPDKTLALIHYDDAAAAAAAALRHPDPRPVYLAVTPPCPSRRDFYLAACVVLGLDLPSFGRPLGGRPARHVVDRLRADLLPVPAHPRWQAALVPEK